MRVGVVGLGKLGLPVALALEQAGHEVQGWDANSERREAIVYGRLAEADYEPHLDEYLRTSEMHKRGLMPVDRLCGWAEILLVTVQTPHDPRFEGTTPVKDDPEDFDYSFLRKAVLEIAATDTDALVVIVSTCLPGTFDSEVRPIAGDLRMAYHPLFIAMGSVIEDFRNPEFILIGQDEMTPTHELDEMYGGDVGLFNRAEFPPVCAMSIASAELTKVAYNAAIGFKLLLANTVAEMSDKVGADADDVMDTLKLADKRIASTAYMTPGMGDGGGCHPRDQIALSWLSGEVGLSHDPFGYIVGARELHAEWLADEWAEAALPWIGVCYDDSMPTIMLGEAYKPNTPLKTGSHARLVLHYAREYGLNPCVVNEPLTDWPVACYFLACPHDWVLAAELPEGSVVVDPWGVYERAGVRTVRPGRRANG